MAVQMEHSKPQLPPGGILVDQPSTKLRVPELNERPPKGPRHRLQPRKPRHSLDELRHQRHKNSERLPVPRSPISVISKLSPRTSLRIDAVSAIESGTHGAAPE